MTMLIGEVVVVSRRSEEVKEGSGGGWCVCWWGEGGMGGMGVIGVVGGGGVEDTICVCKRKTERGLVCLCVCVCQLSEVLAELD